MRHIDKWSLWLCENMASSTKLEVDSASQSRHEQDRATIHGHIQLNTPQKFGKVWPYGI